ncbi:GNAT family N-acetyltransferase [Actinoplanes sp. NPDC049596]|uniref:GNAT family N-acetyltransferase n=1 Tax=unclassified Actinoplanes TaxID=2626549 RepID=UPI0034496073
MTIELSPLTSADLERRMPAMIALFADALVGDHGFTPEEAARESERQTRDLLPDGVATAGQLLRKGVVDGAEVGFLWISLPGTTFETMAWISEIEVAGEHRSRGYGSAMLRAGEAELAARGIGRVGLHVFGHNTGARRLYRRLGYRVLTQIRARSASPTGSPVTLVPMTPGEYARRLDELVTADPMVLVRERPERARTRAAAIGPDELHTAVADGRPVGWVWLAKPTAGRPGAGIIRYLAVDEPYRHQGLARGIVAAAEATVAHHRVPQVGLFVSASTPGAEAFADRLAFPVVSEQLVKDL